MASRLLMDAFVKGAGDEAGRQMVKGTLKIVAALILSNVKEKVESSPHITTDDGKKFTLTNVRGSILVDFTIFINVIDNVNEVCRAIITASAEFFHIDQKDITVQDTIVTEITDQDTVQDTVQHRQGVRDSQNKRPRLAMDNSITIGSKDHSHTVDKTNMTEVFPTNKYKCWSLAGDWGELTGDNAAYKPFHRFVHATHLDITKQILDDRKISSQPVNDTSRLTSNRQLVPHVVWLAPDFQKSSSHGPITFHLPPSVVDLKNCKFFFVETVDYAKTEMASRILVVRANTPETVISALHTLLNRKLRVYNPKSEKGPFKIHEDGTLETLVEGLPHQGKSKRKHTTEFVILGDVVIPSQDLSLYPERDCQSVYLSTNTHSGWCKKLCLKCDEKNTTHTKVVEKIGRRAASRKISIVNNKQRYDVFFTDHSGPPTSPPTMHFDGWKEDEFCKTVCEAVNGSFDQASSAIHKLTTSLRTTQQSLTTTQWQAVLASFACCGPVDVETRINQLHGNFADLYDLIGENADRIASSLERTFLMWFCREILSKDSTRILRSP